MSLDDIRVTIEAGFDAVEIVRLSLFHRSRLFERYLLIIPDGRWLEMVISAISP